jgi:hypothetical protein
MARGGLDVDDEQEAVLDPRGFKCHSLRSTLCARYADWVVTAAKSYRAMTVADLALGLRGMDSDPDRRRLVLEFVEEYRWEPIEVRSRLLGERPATIGDARYDALMAALAEHLAYHDGIEVPEWAYEADRFLEQWWFPIDLPSVRTDALVHSPAAFRIRGIFIGTGALDRA